MPTAPTTTATTRLAHLPGLDGLRALAVVLVLLFHNGFTWMEGGFLGVSVFFTLSGYLITTLLLGEHAGTGGISLRAFWARRFRRLLPASLLAIALALAFTLFAADATQRAEFGGDVLASLAYVANWWFLASDQTYAALFSEPSPLLHFWSLAIEEQFYLLLALAAFAALGRRPRLFAGGTVLLLAATVALPFVTSASDNWLYYATPARLPELLTGVLLALVLSRRTSTGELRHRLTTSTAVALPTIVGLGALGATVWLAATSSIASSWLYRGGFAAFSLVSVALIVATHSPRGLATRALSLPPMQHLGRISYGVYLYHWPIFLWLDPARTGLDGWALFALRMAVTLVLAEASYRFVEMPIRRTGRLGLSLPPLSRLAPAAIVVLVAGAVLASATAPPKAIDFDLAASSMASLGDGVTATPPTPGVAAEGTTLDAVLASLPAEPPTPRVAAFGDSTALMTGFGLGAAITERPEDLSYVEGVTLLGCGVNAGDRRLLRDDLVDIVPRRCRVWADYWEERARAHAPNVAFVQVGPWDVMTRQVTPGGEFLRPGDPEWDATFLDDALTAVDRLADAGVYTLWATAPLPNRNLDPTEHFAGPENVDPERFAHLNTLIARLPELRPGEVSVIDLAGWHAGRDDDETLRPDGVHLSEVGGQIAGREFLVDEILAAYDAAWRSGDLPRLIAESTVAHQQRPAPPALYPGRPLRVAVWSDERTPAVVEQLTAGADAAGIPVEIEVVGNPECGVARGSERRLGDDTLTDSPDCPTRATVAQQLDAFAPHLVVVAPGAHEAAELRPWVDWDQWSFAGDPFIDVWLLREYASAVDLAGRSGAVVALAGLSPGEGAPYTSAINDVVLEVAMAPDRATWLTDITAADAAPWALDQLTARP